MPEKRSTRATAAFACIVRGRVYRWSASGTAFHRNSSAVLRWSTRVPRFHEYSENENRTIWIDLRPRTNEFIFSRHSTRPFARATHETDFINILNSITRRNKRDILKKRRISLCLSKLDQTFRIKIPKSGSKSKLFRRELFESVAHLSNFHLRII